MKIFSTFICFLILGCSSQKVPQNHISAGYQIDEKLLEEIQFNSTAARSPASFAATKITSAKRVYFKTLYQQYLAFTKLSDRPSQIKHCPAFHMDFLETSEFSELISARKTQQKVVAIEKELRELCDKAVSANYYRFENLVNYHVGKKSFHQDPRSIFSLLKISVFENMFELKLHHGVALSHPHLLELTKTFWFSSYLDHHRVNRSALSLRDGGR